MKKYAVLHYWTKPAFWLIGQTYKQTFLCCRPFLSEKGIRRTPEKMPKQFNQGFSGSMNPNLTSELENSQVALRQNITRAAVSLYPAMPPSQDIVFLSSIILVTDLRWITDTSEGSRTKCASDSHSRTPKIDCRTFPQNCSNFGFRLTWLPR